MTLFTLNNPNSGSNVDESVLSDIYPIGSPIPYPLDKPPSDDFFILKGQSFDIKANPILHSIYGVRLLDMRGMAIVGSKDGEELLSYEEDNIKQHIHFGEAKRAGGVKKSTDLQGGHTHPIGRPLSEKLAVSDGTNDADVEYTPHNTYYPIGSEIMHTYPAGLHTHIFDVPSHGHILSIRPTGHPENTIKNYKFNWIVRKG
ncbi:tail fiber protein [Vibrio sp. VB16]|uniref:tail fiber protein n=1 Tax=Vibrio sp. VB16 TaxID=2785746 RepID=UPI0018A04B32|nr:tail fiber protein [Vibrio sp. VB16]UGA55288.1 hypothetical protein IUZ65_002750 [Vibrio sp. VB16]